MQFMTNTFGFGRPAPPEVEKGGFHVGAFLAGWPWLFAHGLPSAGVLDLALHIVNIVAIHRIITGGRFYGEYPELGFFLSCTAWALLRILVGARGYVWAWQHRCFADLEVFWATQRVWHFAGALPLLVSVFILVWPGVWDGLQTLLKQIKFPWV
jgi:hypothetical protein